MTSQPSLLFVFGLGYSGEQLARSALAAGMRVTGTVRTAAKASALRATGLDAQVWTGSEALALPDSAHWLITLPPDAEGCPIARLAGRAAGQAASVTYLSTTGVYGDLSGGWAFESTPPQPGLERARARVLAEQQWLQASAGRVRLVRLPGIYGPGRSAFDTLREGRARRIRKPGQVFSRIHVADLADGLRLLLNKPNETGVFHFCDDEPAGSDLVLAEAARLMGEAPPPEVPFEAAGLSAMAKSFYAECKRVSNARAKAALGWRPKLPSYREGLASILKVETSASFT